MTRLERAFLLVQVNTEPERTIKSSVSGPEGPESIKIDAVNVRQLHLRRQRCCLKPFAARSWWHVARLAEHGFQPQQRGDDRSVMFAEAPLGALSNTTFSGIPPALFAGTGLLPPSGVSGSLRHCLLRNFCGTLVAGRPSFSPSPEASMSSLTRTSKRRCSGSSGTPLPGCDNLGRTKRISKTFVPSPCTLHLCTKCPTERIPALWNIGWPGLPPPHNARQHLLWRSAADMSSEARAICVTYSTPGRSVCFGVLAPDFCFRHS